MASIALVCWLSSWLFLSKLIILCICWLLFHLGIAFFLYILLLLLCFDLVGILLSEDNLFRFIYCFILIFFILKVFNTSFHFALLIKVKLWLSINLLFIVLRFIFLGMIISFFYFWWLFLFDFAWTWCFGKVLLDANLLRSFFFNRGLFHFVFWFLGILHFLLFVDFGSPHATFNVTTWLIMMVINNVSKVYGVFDWNQFGKRFLGLSWCSLRLLIDPSQ